MEEKLKKSHAQHGLTITGGTHDVKTLDSICCDGASEGASCQEDLHENR